METRTQEEILNKIAEIDKENNFLDFRRGDLVNYLNYGNAKSFLKEGATEEDWTPIPCTEDEIKKEMKEYLEFAWDKANNFRGISASRSMDHYSAWFWLLNDDSVTNDFQDYEFYGKDNLVEVSKYLGVDPKQYDDGIRLNEEPDY